MIGLTLLLLIGFYVSLFVLVGVRTKRWTPRLLMWLLLLSPLVALTWDMPVGYYRFKAMCEKEGGVKVFEAHPAQAKVLRLGAKGFVRDGGLLLKYPTLLAVEAELGSSEPPAYGRYERDPSVPPPRTSLEHLQYERKAIKARPIDRVEHGPHGNVTVEQGQSEADYILSKEYETRPIRLSITRRWLRKSDGAPIASATAIFFQWTNPMNTLF